MQLVHKFLPPPHRCRQVVRKPQLARVRRRCGACRRAVAVDPVPLPALPAAHTSCTVSDDRVARDVAALVSVQQAGSCGRTG